MAQLLKFLSVLFILAAISPDKKLATSLPCADEAFTNVSAVYFSTEESNKDRRSLGNDSETTNLETLITKKLFNFERFARSDHFFNEKFLCKTYSYNNYNKKSFGPIPKKDSDYYWEEAICLHPGTKCGENIEGVDLPKHLTGTCQQRYVYFHLLASDISEYDGKPAIRVGCECKVTSNN